MGVRVIAIFFGFCSLGFTPKLKANELDNAAACSGVVLGNASIDYSLGDEVILMRVQFGNYSIFK